MKSRPKLPQHESLQKWGLLSTKIEILSFGHHLEIFSKTVFYEVNFALLCSHLQVLLISKFSSERVILFFVDRQGNKVSCCGRFGLDFFYLCSFCLWFCCDHSLVKFIYSEKATKFCEISTLLLSYVVPVKIKVEIISQNFVAFSEYMNFKK